MSAVKQTLLWQDLQPLHRIWRLSLNMLLTPSAGSQGGGSFPAHHTRKEHRDIARPGILGKEIKNRHLNQAGVTRL